ncbi:MAG: cupin domain-containing protein [Polyangiaceae bacterium]|nr:cupin domain-containing protein [Polyangiaceae bacterium]
MPQTPATSAKDIIEKLGLTQHPEGGWYKETWRANESVGPAGSPSSRKVGTAIFYLLSAGETSAWHRIDATEIWHFYAGAPLELRTQQGQTEVRTQHLGTNFLEGELPQIIIAPGAWQCARSLGAWTLVGCTVSPGFEFEKFELAPAGWEPGADA